MASLCCAQVNIFLGCQSTDQPAKDLSSTLLWGWGSDGKSSQAVSWAPWSIQALWAEILTVLDHNLPRILLTTAFKILGDLAPTSAHTLSSTISHLFFPELPAQSSKAVCLPPPSSVTHRVGNWLSSQPCSVIPTTIRSQLKQQTLQEALLISGMD